MTLLGLPLGFVLASTGAIVLLGAYLGYRSGDDR